MKPLLPYLIFVLLVLENAAANMNMTRTQVLLSNQASTIFYDIDYSPISSSASTSNQLQLLAAASFGKIYLWNTVTWQLEGVVTTNSNRAIRQVKYSPDGTRAATASDDGTVRIWNTTSNNMDRNANSHHVDRSQRRRHSSTAFRLVE